MSGTGFRLIIFVLPGLEMVDVYSFEMDGKKAKASILNVYHNADLASLNAGGLPWQLSATPPAPGGICFRFYSWRNCLYLH